MLKVPARHIIVLMLLCTVAVVFAAAKSHVPPQKHSGHPARQAQEAPRPPRYSLDDLYPSTNVPVDIPDGPGGVALSTITVPEDITITDINVMVSITHNWIRDLRISLIPPASDTLEVILLELLPQDSAINMVDTWFNDEAVTLIDDGVPPFTGVFRPQNPLSALDDLNANGTWTLRVEDMFRVDSGRVEAWAIFVNPDISLAGTITDEDTDDPIGGVSVVVLGGAAQTISDNAGEYAIEGIAPGTYSVQFTNENYDTLTYPDVVIAAGSPYELDVALHPRFLLREFSTRPTDSVAIPDQGEATLTYTLSETLLVYDVDITVNIAHTFPSDLSLFLTGPGNQILQLVESEFGTDSTDNFTQCRFDDEAAQPFAHGHAPWTDSWRPLEPLSELDSLTSNGTWSLQASDDFEADVGTILGFTLHLRVPNPVAVDDPLILHPASFNLSVYPNPFNSETRFAFDLPRAGLVELRLYDLLGREVSEILNVRREAGSQSIAFDASALPSGVYIARLTVLNQIKSVKLLLLR